MFGITLHLGLDVHRDDTTIAIAEPGPKGEIHLFRTVSSDVDRLEKRQRRIAKAHPNAQLEVAYEAGPCGFVIARRPTQLKIACLVASAPNRKSISGRVIACRPASQGPRQ